MICLDWLQGVVSADRWHEVEDLLLWHFGTWEYGDGGGWGYRERLEWDCGVRLYRSVRVVNGAEVAEQPHMALMVPGGALGRLSADEVCHLVVGLVNLGLHCTRLDAAFDDADRSMSPSRLYRDYISAGAYSGPRSARYIESQSDSGVGESVYLGKKGRDGGGVEVCIYDKSVQSAGEVMAIRWEVRFWKAGDRAASALEYVCPVADGSPASLTAEQLRERLGHLIGGAVDFHISAAEHLERRERPEWWQALRGRLGAARVRPAEREEGTKGDWLWSVMRRIGGPLAELEHVYGDSETLLARIEEALMEGRAWLSPARRAHLDKFRNLELPI